MHPAVRLPSRTGTVVVVADRSLSMPPDAQTAQEEAIDIIQSKMSAGDDMAVVSFARGAFVEQPPQPGAFAGFVGRVGPDASNLAEALDVSLSLIQRGSPGRIVVISDGRFTGADPAAAAAAAAARDVAIDYRLLERSFANDVAIERLDVPSSVAPGESFMITAWIHSPVSREISYELLCGDRPAGTGTRTVGAGLTPLTFRDRADQPGTFAYRLRIAPGQADPIPENNSAKVLVGIEGLRPLLCVSGNEASKLPALLAAGNINVTVAADKCQWSLAELSKYSAVLIENLPAEQIGTAGMANIAAWVSQTGAGMMMTGGKTSYGPGGYFRSPLEPVMPISMELRREHRKLALAIVVALDRSGSMAVGVGGGRTKMDLANIATAQVLDLLSAMDEFGCVAVDSSSHIIVNIAPVANKPATRSKILRIDSRGGGIFVYEALSTAVGMLARAKAGTRHIILFADANDSEEPGKYKELLAQCRKAGVTCSVVGLGTPGDKDAALLRDIAKRGAGRCLFTDKAEELPRLFAQDTFVVARNSFLDEPTAFKITAGMLALTGQRFSAPPALGGYNLCYIRPGANPAALTQDEYKAPVVAAWQAGLGRVLCYTGEADGKYTGPIAGWDQVGHFLSSQARWVAGRGDTLPANMLATQKLIGSACQVTLHLDPQRQATPFERTPVVTALRGLPGQTPTARKLSMQWTSADELTVNIPMEGQETVLATVDVPGVGRASLAPVCLPYSPEFRPRTAHVGKATLQRLAKATGGTERVELAGIWQDLPRRPQLLPIAAWLLLAAAVAVLLEVLQRRTGLLTAFRLPKLRLRRREPAAVRRPRRRWPWRRKPAAATEVPPELEPQIPTADRPPAKPAQPQPEKPKKTPTVLDALDQASHRAKKRTRK